MVNNKIKNICCIGAGYVGGPSMAVLAKYCPNIRVNVVDINEERIRLWNCSDLKKLPVYEPNLDKVIKKCRGVNLFFSINLKECIEQADMIFLSVNTPTKTKGIGAGYASDLKWIEASSRQIAEFARNHTIVVEKSTLPVKTAETIKSILNSSISGKKNIDYQNIKKTFSILSNPEFLAEGSAINDLENPDRVLIGGEDEESIKKLSKIYENWVDSEKIIETNLWSSELSKLVANAFLAQRISSINTISALCEATGANIKEVTKAIGTDRRIGNKFLETGPGFGGSCFKKDILNLVYLSRFYGLNEVADYWEQIILINSWQQKRISELIIKKLYGTLSEKKLAIFGFSFKANTNDTRESPSISIANNLLEEGARLNIYDPQVSEKKISEILIGKKIDIFQSPFDAAKDVDAIIIMTEWKEFNRLNWNKIFSLMRKPAWIFDTRLCLETTKLKNIGFNIWSVGTDDQK